MKAMLVVLMVILSGCSIVRPGDGRVGVQEMGPHEYMFVAGSGKENWYSALELENLARNYAEEKELGFDFQNTSPTIWISTDGSRTLAKVFFDPPKLGMDALVVWIGRNGKVLDHNIAPTICGNVAHGGHAP